MKTIVVAVTILILEGCSLFEKDEKPLATHPKSNGEKIEILYVALGATTEDVIQVKRSNRKEPVKVFTKYNCLESSKLLNDTLLQVVVNDTGYFKNKADTFMVTVK